MTGRNIVAEDADALMASPPEPIEEEEAAGGFHAPSHIPVRHRRRWEVILERTCKCGRTAPRLALWLILALAVLQWQLAEDAEISALRNLRRAHNESCAL